SKVVEIARERAKELLRKKQPFVWNATNLSPMVRGKQIKLFTQYHASIRIIYLETDWGEQFRRNAGRADAVPEQAICHMMEELVLPEAKEAHQVQWYCV
ncbi:MAG: AAA family ATPase, partial [Oscillospiraceae bacterium]|nr:AAA family ATPase [Oscillospiraceae bacterium]